MMKSIQTDNDKNSSAGNSVESVCCNTDIPQPMDIVLGRGKGYGKNPGNVVFQGTFHPIVFSYFFDVNSKAVPFLLQLINHLAGLRSN
jgi:hypothetical protein